jgi:hypothetical protein
MADKTSAHIEMTIALPLDVVASKLVRIEEELRHLSRRTLSFEVEREEGSLAKLIAVRLDNIRDSLDSIRTLLSVLEDDAEPVSSDALDDVARPQPAHRKRYPELDD